MVSVMIVDQGGYTVELFRDTEAHYWMWDLDESRNLAPVPMVRPTYQVARQEDCPVDLTDFLEVTAGLMMLCEMAHVPYTMPSWYKGLTPAEKGIIF